MNHRQGFTLIELMIVVVIIGLLASIAIPNFISMQDKAKEAATKQHSHTVQLAMEDHAVRHDGIYSAAPADITPLLPNAMLLKNAFTNAFSEPQYGAAATTVGQVGVVTVAVGGFVTAYTVTAFGKDRVIMTLYNNQ